MDAFIKKRGILKGTLTKIRTFLDKLDENQYDVEAAENKLQQLEKAWSTYEDIHVEIILLCANDEELAQHEAENDQFVEKYDTMKVKLVQLIKKKQVIQQPQQGSSHSSGSQPIIFQQEYASEVKLPRIDLPTFSGEYQDWTAFWDQFQACVHNNRKLSGSQKLNYLKSSLKGDASKLLKSFTITDANYALATKILQERYDNKRNIVYAHLQLLFNLSACSNESAMSLRKLLDSIIENVRALNVLGEPTDHWDSVLVYILSSKMDEETRKQWELSFESTDLPTFEQCTKFLQKRCNALEVIGSTKQKILANMQNDDSDKEKANGCYHVSSEEKQCPLCKENHFLFYCPDFLKMTVNERTQIARQIKACFICLRTGHGSQDCPSNGCCKKCSKRSHNTLLHFELQQKKSVHILEDEISEEDCLQSSVSSVMHTSKFKSSQTQVLLSTVMVKVKDSTGKFQQCRALLDDGSQATIISENCIRRLGLRRRKAHIPINGISSSSAGYVYGIVHVDLHSNMSNFKISADAYILQKITRRLPNYHIEHRDWPHIRNMALADPNYFQPGDIDILIGKDIHPFIVLDGKLIGTPGTPVAMNTEFGWTLGGPVKVPITSQDISTNHMYFESDGMLQNFWQSEEVFSQSPALSPEEKGCEKHFKENHSGDSTGRITSQLPFKNDKFVLEESRSSAAVRLIQMERRRTENPHHQQQCNQSISEFMDLGDRKEENPNEIMKGHPNHWKMFDANRVSENQDLLGPQQLSNLISEENSADVTSRGKLRKKTWINWVQIKCYISDENLRKGSQLKSLNPFLDQDEVQNLSFAQQIKHHISGILRVGGSLRHSSLCQKHPILPRKTMLKHQEIIWLRILPSNPQHACLKMNIWKKCQEDYLARLQQYPKWMNKKPNLKIEGILDLR